jgi:hypothetical protein
LNAGARIGFDLKKSVWLELRFTRSSLGRVHAVIQFLLH